jgi:hypothetical protein
MDASDRHITENTYDGNAHTLWDPNSRPTLRHAGAATVAQQHSWRPPPVPLIYGSTHTLQCDRPRRATPLMIQRGVGMAARVDG